MKITIKAKTYGPLTVHAAGDGELDIVTGTEFDMPSAAIASAEAAAPSDHILAALGSCIAISMRAAATGLKLDIGKVDLSVTATKATDLPNRFGRFDVCIRIEDDVTADAYDALLARTKEYCTISNTLSADIVFTRA